MEPLDPCHRRATLAVLFDVLTYMRAHVATAGVQGRGGLSPDDCRELNALLNIVHNIPLFVEGTHPLGFQEDWFSRALTEFDRRNGTRFAAAYRDALSEETTG